MIKQITSGILLFILCSCNTGSRDKEAAQQAPAFRVSTFRSGQGWAYSIFINNKEYIRQHYMPVIEGQHPFTSEQQAKTVAEFVVTKLKHNAGPSLRAADLEQLKVIAPSDLHAAQPQ